MTTSRRLLLAAGACSLAAPMLALAQGPVSVRRIAHLSASSAAAEQRLRSVFTSALQELGWTEGRNLIVDSRYTEGDSARVAPLVAELLALKPDIFVTAVDREVRVVAAATTVIPIVFLFGGDPVGLGLVKSLARPGGNVTGMSVLSDELGPKRLSLLKEAVPGIDKVGVLFHKDDPRSEATVATLEQSSRQLGVKLLPAAIRGVDDIAAAFDRLSKSGAQAVIHLPVALLFMRRQQLADLALEHRMAAAFTASEYAEAGALMAYGTDYGAVVRRGAALVDRILKGADPATIPVEQANVYELVVNRRTARALGIELPHSLMLQATRVIE